MRADWTASGASTSGSTAPLRAATRRSTGGAATTSTTSAERHRGERLRKRRRGRPRRSRLVVPRGRADLRNHGAAYGSRWRPAGYALRWRAGCVTAERNGPDVLTDERLPFGALAEADFQPNGVVTAFDE